MIGVVSLFHSNTVFVRSASCVNACTLIGQAFQLIVTRVFEDNIQPVRLQCIFTNAQCV